MNREIVRAYGFIGSTMVLFTLTTPFPLAGTSSVVRAVGSLIVTPFIAATTRFLFARFLAIVAARTQVAFIFESGLPRRRFRLRRLLFDASPFKNSDWFVIIKYFTVL